MELFKAHSTKSYSPQKFGEYNTDKGRLYYFPEEKEWSCRRDEISEEYPTVWYERMNLDKLGLLQVQHEQRMEIASRAMQGILSNPSCNIPTNNVGLPDENLTCQCAICYADELIKQLNK